MLNKPLLSTVAAFVLLAMISCFDAAHSENAEGETWAAQPSQVKSLTERRPEFNYYESKVPDYVLPDPLVGADGERVADSHAWSTQRRPEILELFKTHVYGRSPGRPDNMTFRVTDLEPNALEGKATRKQVRVFFDGTEDGPSMEILIYLPKGTDAGVPTFVGLNFSGNHSINADKGIHLGTRWVRDRGGDSVSSNRATEKARGTSASRWPVETILERGYGVATIYYGDIDPDFHDEFKNGVHGYFDKTGDGERAPDAWGSIAAWAWGLSRAMDYFETDKDVDHKRVAVIGHSRLGKTSLWAGASDERFGIVISNDSGCGGAALSRRAFGETVGRINTSFPHWFCDNFKKYNGNEAALPVDQHMLIALAAPRPVYIASADEDLWADPRGEFLSAKAASPVYGLFGKKGLDVKNMPPLESPVHNAIGHHIRSGRHNVTDFDWQNYMDFADKHFKTDDNGFYFPPVEQLPEQSGLPDPFLKYNGSRVKNRKDWKQQREYLKAKLAHYQYGHMPPKPEDTSIKTSQPRKVMDGLAEEIEFTITMKRKGKSLDFHAALLKPLGKGPFPVIIKNDRNLFSFPDERDQKSFREALKRGYVICKFQREDLALDKMGNRDSGMYPLYPEYDLGAIAAWGWGFQLVIDALEEMKFIDTKKIVSTGHSRGGKAALCAGIYDERITLCAPNSSGTGGTGSHRYFEEGQRPQTLAHHIGKNNHWWSTQYLALGGLESKVPFDAHFNKALIAPRGLFNAHARQDYWANPYGTELTHRAAMPIFEWLGAGGNIGLNWREGGHAQGFEDWVALLDFADAHFFGKKVERKFNDWTYPDAKLPVSWTAPK